MTAVFDIIGHLLLIAVLGFGVVRLGWLSDEQVRGLGRFLVTIALPAVLVLAIGDMRIADVIGDGFFVFYIAVGACTGALAWLIARRVHGASPVESTTMTLSVWIPNNIIIGYPITLQVMGEANLPYFVAVAVVENLLWLPLALVLFEASCGEKQGLPVIARRIASNPIVLAVVAGLALSAIQLTLPPVVTKSLGALGQSVSGLALFFVGASLGMARSGLVTAKVSTAIALRLGCAPVIAAALVALFPALSGPPGIALILFSAMPCFSVLPAIAAPYGTGPLAASIQVTGTLLSAFSLTLVLYLLGQ